MYSSSFESSCLTLSSYLPTYRPDRSPDAFYNNTKTFLSIPIDTQCCQSSGICGEQYQVGRYVGRYVNMCLSLHPTYLPTYLPTYIQSDVVFAPPSSSSSSSPTILASRLRMQLQPLRDEADFINSYYYLRKYVCMYVCM